MLQSRGLDMSVRKKNNDSEMQLENVHKINCNNDAKADDPM